MRWDFQALDTLGTSLMRIKVVIICITPHQTPSSPTTSSDSSICHRCFALVLLPLSPRQGQHAYGRCVADVHRPAVALGATLDHGLRYPRTLWCSRGQDAETFLFALFSATPSSPITSDQYQRYVRTDVASALTRTANTIASTINTQLRQCRKLSQSCKHGSRSTSPSRLLRSPSLRPAQSMPTCEPS